MEEKKNQIMRILGSRPIQNAALVLLTAVVIGLTAAVIALLTLNAAFEEKVPFRMEQISASDVVDASDIGEHFLPSFIGIRAKGEQKGISSGYNVVCDVYSVFSHVLFDVLGGNFREVAEERFEGGAAEQSFVYMKYHSEVPYQTISVCAGGGEEAYETAVGVYELFILPDKGFRILVRSMDGKAYEFDGTYEPYFTVDALAELLQSYQRNFADFVFSADSLFEPCFTERVRTKGMLVTEKTAALIQNRDNHISDILRLFTFNPDKLNTHEESDIGYVYVENHGVLRLLDDSVEYTAASSDGGISVNSYLMTYGKKGYTLADYIGTACLIADKVKALSPHYAGGDGEILLHSAETDEEGVLTLRFMYTFDNLPLSGCEPAMEVRFADGRMLAFRLYSVSVRNLGTQQNSLMESWYRDVALSCCPSGEYIVDIRQVYPVDFYAESIDAEWAAVYGRIVKETAGRTRK
ncbi:MAG: hypothetical protein E7638_01255 [Ruminococcaceae bacterium]|nr:hypothetical protein [Oscillospiraceae bacterium]